METDPIISRGPSALVVQPEAVANKCWPIYWLDQLIHNNACNKSDLGYEEKYPGKRDACCGLYCGSMHFLWKIVSSQVLDKRLRIKTAIICKMLEQMVIYKLKWILSSSQVVDGLTKSLLKRFWIRYINPESLFHQLYWCGSCNK